MKNNQSINKNEERLKEQINNFFQAIYNYGLYQASNNKDNNRHRGYIVKL